jgi:prepilin-type N-terminal cleavage/methylation domain-containing protein
MIKRGLIPMNYNDVRKNENKGFSLVELIVVIAIMAVLTSVLAPSLLQYVERSRAQKDDSAMGEVTNAILLAMSDQDIYDEVLSNSLKNNYSCYIDKTTKEDSSGTKEGRKDVISTSKGNNTDNQYQYGSNARLDDEQQYFAAGVMRGMTITFHPADSGSNSASYVLADGIVNEFAAGKATNNIDGNARNDLKVYSGGNVTAVKLGELAAKGNSNTYLYNRVRATVGDRVELTSQTYRNSNYTVFIRMGSTGGNQATAQDAIAVYGQWSGTNLFERQAAPTLS